MKKKFDWKGAAGRLPVRLVMVVLALSVVFPLIWNLYSSLKSNTEIMADPWALPTALHWENYLSAFQKASMGDYFLNSILVVVLAAALHLLLVIPITYALARYRFFGSKLLVGVLLACIFIQEPYILVPLYLQLSRVHLLDNLIALAVIYATVLFLAFALVIFNILADIIQRLLQTRKGGAA